MTFTDGMARRRRLGAHKTEKPMSLVRAIVVRIVPRKRSLDGRIGSDSSRRGKGGGDQDGIQTSR
jgi:hypothetical protein